MKVVDIADEVFRELGSPSTISIPAISFWLRTNIGSLNNSINRDFSIKSGTLELVRDVDGVETEMDADEASVLKKMYHVHYYDQQIRTNLGAASTDAVVEVASDGQRVRKINKTEIIRHLTTIKKQATEELNFIIHSFKTNASEPRQVTGDDRVEGNYNPHGTEDYNRTK
tara:strand:- start:1148 stop:1657 length:510 start_codon:yes stop_codon:yes gene_type:complete